MLVQPYLILDGRCDEAVEFYRKAVNAEVLMLMRNKDSPDPHPPGMLPPGSENKVMHVSMKIGDTTVMASDGHCKGKPAFAGFSLSLTVADDGSGMAAELEIVVLAVLDDGGREVGERAAIHEQRAVVLDQSL